MAAALIVIFLAAWLTSGADVDLTFLATALIVIFLTAWLTSGADMDLFFLEAALIVLGIAETDFLAFLTAVLLVLALFFLGVLTASVYFFFSSNKLLFLIT